MRHRVIRAVVMVVAIVALCGALVLGCNFVAVKRGDDIKARYGHLVGSPASLLARDFRGPDRVERLAPMTYDTATGAVSARYEPYLVWIYDLAPGGSDLWTLRVIVDDKTEVITRFKGPWD